MNVDCSDASELIFPETDPVSAFSRLLAERQGKGLPMERFARIMHDLVSASAGPMWLVDLPGSGRTFITVDRTGRILKIAAFAKKPKRERIALKLAPQRIQMVALAVRRMVCGRMI